jgi:RNA polymerase sigma factor (TIGR02999 family)
MSEVSRVLDAVDAGEPLAAEELFPLVYDELRKLAAQKLAHEQPGQTMDGTGLVHEAYLRLVGPGRFNGRRHFFAAAAEAMRRILVDNARRKKSQKHGGGMARCNLDDIAGPSDPDELLALDEALDRLAAVDPQAAELVRLRYFAGLSIPQAADLLGISPRTADGWWAFARAWLRTALQA